MSQRLRVAVLLDPPPISSWVQLALAELVLSPHAEIVLVVVDGTPRSARATTSSAAMRLYERIDRRLAGLDARGDIASGVDSMLPDGPQLTAIPFRRHDAFDLRTADLEAIRQVRPDVLLKLGFAPLTGAILDVARLGLWSFDHVEEARRGVAVFAREQLGRDPVVELCLRATTGVGARILQRGYAPSDRTFLARTRRACDAKSLALLRSALRDAEAPQEPETSGQAATSPPDPGAADLLRAAAATIARVARNRWSQRGATCLWFVALRPTSEPLATGSLDGFRPVTAPVGRYFADPFLIEEGPRTWLFVEDASLATGKGVIRCAEVLADGTLGESRVVLECDYHLSYPFVFRSGDAWFLLPETSAHRTVELWRAVEFPWRWELEKVLLHDVNVVDATLHEEAGRQWLFAAMRGPGGSFHDELYVFHANSLFDDWRPHERNPVVSDLRHARPAGRLFREDGQLYRPAQDASGGYGSAIRIHRVDAFDEARYRETEVRRIDADWFPGAVATHTLNRAGGFDAIDARAWVRRGRSHS